MNLIELAKLKAVFICTAESLTAGLVAAELAKTPGASEVLLGGVVAYQDVIKSQILGVSKVLMESQTSVDPEVAAQMALGACAKFANAAGLVSERVIALATSGVAGPGSVGHQIPGTVYIALATGEEVAVYAEQFEGSRAVITTSTVERSISLLREHLEAF